MAADDVALVVRELERDHVVDPPFVRRSSGGDGDRTRHAAGEGACWSMMPSRRLLPDP
jgi:hypothetical protein